MAGLAHHLSIKPRLGAPKARRRDLASLTGSSLCWEWRSEVWPSGLGSVPSFHPLIPANPAFSDSRSQCRSPSASLLPALLLSREDLPAGASPAGVSSVLEALSLGPAQAPSPPPRQETTSSAVSFHFITTHETWRLRRETNKEFSFHLNLAHNPLTN